MAARSQVGRFERTVEQAKLDAEAAALRAQRLSLRQIAARQGCSIPTACERIKRAIAAVPYESVEELRRIELDSLDEQERRLLKVQETDHYKVDHGRVIKIDGEPMIDTGPIIATAMAILRIKDMRAKLTGEYAPVKSAVTVLTEDVTDAAIRQLESELAHRSADREPAST